MCQPTKLDRQPGRSLNKLILLQTSTATQTAVVTALTAIARRRGMVSQTATGMLIADLSTRELTGEQTRSICRTATGTGTGTGMAEAIKTVGGGMKLGRGAAAKIKRVRMEDIRVEEDAQVTTAAKERMKSLQI